MQIRIHHRCDAAHPRDENRSQRRRGKASFPGGVATRRYACAPLYFPPATERSECGIQLVTDLTYILTNTALVAIAFSAAMDDEAVIATNDDASECKRNAVQLGYWKDDYIGYLIKQTQRRAPEINRGYYARVKSVERLVHKFLQKAGGNGQIINLGCGFDTLFWRLKDQNVTIANFVEIDFPSVTARKCYMIKRSKHLLGKIHDQDGEIKLSSTDMHAGVYHCLGVDLRNITELETKLQQAEIVYDRPTLFVAECVLVYIENECVNRLLRFFSDKFPNALFVNYEMCNMNDTFGDVMMENLRIRGCSLAGISYCKNLETQQSRFSTNNWTGTNAWDMVKVYYSFPTSEREQVEKIEFLDEQELLIQLFQHYCICIAWNGILFADITFEDN